MTEQEDELRLLIRYNAGMIKKWVQQPGMASVSYLLSRAERTLELIKKLEAVK